MNKLNDKVVVITGAGSGLGRALAKAFCQEGCQVIGLGRSEKTLQETQSFFPDAFTFHVVDVADYSQVNTCVKDMIKTNKQIDYWFNNAAVYPKVNFLDESAEDFANAMAINVNGIANCCKAVLPSMLVAGFGRIFNVGSWADLGPIENSAVYSASKGAIHALTKAIAKDIAHHGKDVLVHEWIPGHLNTQMSGYTGIDPSIAAAYGVGLAQREGDKETYLFQGDKIWQPPLSFKQKIKKKLCFWRS